MMQIYSLSILVTCLFIVKHTTHWELHIDLGRHYNLRSCVFVENCDATGAPFPPNFRDVVKTILKRLFRVYAHIYHSHFQMIMNLEEVKHLNTCFKHFTLFIMVNSISTSMQITVSRSPFVTFNSACKYLLEGHTNIRLVVDKDERTFDLSHDFPTRMTFYPTVARLYIHSSVLIISELSWLLWFSYAIVKKFHLKKNRNHANWKVI